MAGRAMVAALLMGLGLTPATSSIAEALECRDKPVKARGTPGLIEATAQSRARSAWIKKVRASKRLGRDYAAWLRAKSPSYTCHRVGRSLICEATATPCRIEPVAR